MAGKDPQIDAVAAIIRQVNPDILVLTDFDYDGGGAALGAFGDLLDFEHRFSLAPNSGLATGLDLDGDGRTATARDAQGYGRFAGDGGLAILSVLPIDTDAVRDFSALLWKDLPGAILPEVDGAPFPSAEAQAVQRLSSTGHWAVPILLETGPLTLLVWSATPPVFDGDEDRNGLRNRDELRLWTAYLDGLLDTAPAERFILAGNANLDPADGDGRREAIASFLADPRILDPLPVSDGGRLAADPNHFGDPALDTVDWTSAGNLRVSYVLPSNNLSVLAAGVFWPSTDSDLATLLGQDGLAAGPHRLVWVDIEQ